MGNNNAGALYATIFETINSLKDKENPMDIDRAKAISGAVQSAINLAKVEVDYMKVKGGNEVTFFDSNQKNTEISRHIIGQKVVTHRLK